jgi:predicted PurR-regulated permease PerM
MVGVLTTLGLWLLGIPSALALGLLAGVLEFVPFLGPILSAVPAVALALGEGMDTMLWVVGLYVAVQQIEGALITPLVQQHTVDLPPALTIFAIVAFGVLFGPLGILLATPLAVVVFVLVKKLWVREVLHENTELPGEPEAGG